MKLVLCALSALALLSAPAFAQVIEFSGTPTQIDGLNVYPQATVQTPKGPVVLKLTGQGRRLKFGALKLYIAASYVSDVDAWRQATDTSKVTDLFTDADRKALGAAVAGQPVRVLALTMEGSLPAASIQSSFKHGLQVNKLCLETGPNCAQATPGLKEVLDRFEVNLGKGDVASIATWTEGEQQKLTVEAQGKSENVVAPALGDNFWKIWFGKNDEKDLQNLQVALVGSKK